MFRRMRSMSLHVKSAVCIVLSIVILAVGLGLNAHISSRSLRRHIAALNTRTLQLQVETTDNALSGMEMFLVRKVLTSDAFHYIAFAAEGDELRLRKSQLMRELVDEISFINWNGGFFLYSDAEGMQFVVKDAYDTRPQHEIAEVIQTSLQGEDPEKKCARWTPIEYGDSYLLIRGYYSDGLLLGAWIPADALVGEHPAGAEDIEGEIWLAAEDGRVLATSAGKVSNAEENGSNQSDDRLAVHVPSGTAPLVWWYAVDFTGNFHGDDSRIAGILIFAALFALIALLWWWLNRSVLRSIYVMVGAIQKMDYSDLNLRLSTEGHASEFQLLFRTFNGMITTIKDLKTDIVNQTLEKEKAEIESLQLQIKPHFFLNSMNIIYELAELKSYEKIQTMTRCIMEYLRYSFLKVDEMISWEKEIAHIQSYVTMQKMRYQELLDFRLDASSVDPEIKLPPFLLQPFIENAVKYGGGADKHIQVVMDAWQDEDEVLIVIRDAGSGFREEVLEAFHEEAPIKRSDGTGCVGLENVRKRLYLTYGDRASLEIYNDGEQGATVEISIPAITDAVGSVIHGAPGKQDNERKDT